MTAAHLPKVAGINPPIPSSPHTAAPSPFTESRPIEQLAAIQDRLASWISDLTTLHELTERLARTTTLDDALHEMLRAGASLVGARRGLIVLEPDEPPGEPGRPGFRVGQGRGTAAPGAPGAPHGAGGPHDAGATGGSRDPGVTVGLGLGRADLGTIETVPHSAAAGRTETEVIIPDLLHGPGVGHRHREVAHRLGFGASYSLRLVTDTVGQLGAAVWFYDEPAEPTERHRHLVGLYCRYAAEHAARLAELGRAQAALKSLHDELLPTRLPRVAGVRMAVRHNAGPSGGGDWYDALPLPEGALGLAVGGVNGAGPSAAAAMGRLKAGLRAYAVMEGEDPVAVLSDLELLLRLTEPGRSATALFAYAEPDQRRVLLAGAGHCPPLVVGDCRTEFVETTLSAPLGMLSCWEAPSVELPLAPGETLLLYTDGLLHRTGEPMDRAFARLHAAASSAPRSARQDPGYLADHVLHAILPEGLDAADDSEDVVLLAARFG
jgi:serine phosphatase RsbU (regulator of sigma subunit)